MSNCQMGVSYFRLDDTVDTYESLKRFFVDWGLTKVGEHHDGNETGFKRVTTFKGCGITFDVIWFKNLATVRFWDGEKRDWSGDMVEIDFDEIIGSFLPYSDHNTFDFQYNKIRTGRIAIRKKDANNGEQN